MAGPRTKTQSRLRSHNQPIKIRMITHIPTARTVSMIINSERLITVDHPFKIIINEAKNKKIYACFFLKNFNLMVFDLEISLKYNSRKIK